MTKLVDALVGQTVSLICLGEYVGFLHFQDGNYCSFEVEAKLVENNGAERPLLPDPSTGSVRRVLGKTVQAAVVADGTLSIDFEECVVRAVLMPGYESVSIRIGENEEVLMA